jgi:hypothetical protein
MYREPPDWLKRHLAFFERWMYHHDNPYPVLRLFGDFSLLFLMTASIISAITAATIARHILWALGAIAYAAVFIYARNRRRFSRSNP